MSHFKTKRKTSEKKKESYFLAVLIIILQNFQFKLKTSLLYCNLVQVKNNNTSDENCKRKKKEEEGAKEL